MYQVIFEPGAEDDLDRLDKTIAEKVIKKIDWLSKNADVLFHHQLSSLPDELKGLCRIHAGDWIILYWVYHNEKEIKIYGIEHRSKAYKNL